MPASPPPPAAAMAHTPGPWVLHRPYPDQPTYFSIDAGCGYHCTADDDGFCVRSFMSEANARLIAAAPDLLAALTNSTHALAYAISAMEDGDPIRRKCIVTLEAARAALARATAGGEG